MLTYDESVTFESLTTIWEVPKQVRFYVFMVASRNLVHLNIGIRNVPMDHGSCTLPIGCYSKVFLCCNKMNYNYQVAKWVCKKFLLTLFKENNVG